jgi:hypothetical protein
MTVEIFGHASVDGEELRSGDVLGESRERGWKSVPAGCPEHMRKFIIETRTAKLKGRMALPYLPAKLAVDPWHTSAAKRLSDSL